MIRVLVVDDHPIVRTGLCALLHDVDLEVVAAAADGEEGVRLSGELQPDVVLMDLSLPGLDGVEATRRIRAQDPAVQVAVLTWTSDGGRVWDALNAGAVGYLLKDAAPAQLRDAVRAVSRGESPLDPRAARSMLELHRPGASEVGLTGRERQVLAQLALGRANKQIGRSLGISETTVKVHVTSIFHRLGVADRTSAALWAQRHALDEPPGR